MAKYMYMLSAHGSATPERPRMTEAEQGRMTDAVHRLESEMESDGALVFGGWLHHPWTATVVTPVGKDLETTDGPFGENSDHLGGFYVIRADDLNVALRWAHQVAVTSRSAIEVRPFVDEMR